MSVSVTTTPLSSSTLSYFSSSSIFLSHKFTHSCSLSKKPINSLSISHSPIHSQLATLPILSFDGEKVGETTLSLKSAPQETARAVVHRGITTDLTNKRRGTASTLTRAEVRGGGKKPYPQKKTGRARQGSRRTPLRPGGGVVFGPKPKDWSIKINKKEKRLAISTALSSALANGVVIEDFGDKFEKPKTKEFIGLLSRLGIDPCEKSLFLMTDVPDNVRLSGRNIGTLKMLTPRTLNLFDILNSDKLVFTKDAVEYLNEAYGYDLDEDSEEDEAYGIYRFLYNDDDTSSEIVKSYKKNDGDPSNMGTNENISDEVKIKNREKYTQESNITNVVCSTRSCDDKVDKSANVEENVVCSTRLCDDKVDKSANVEENVVCSTRSCDDKVDKSVNVEENVVCSTRSCDDKVDKSANVEENVVCSTRSCDDKVDKSANVEENVVCSTRSCNDKVDKNANVEENVKDIKDAKVDSVTDGAKCSPRKAGKPGIFQINDGCDEGLEIYSGRKESSVTSEDSQEDRDADERKHFTDPEESDFERNKRLETMIARRKARKCFSFQVRHSLMKGGNHDPVEHLASILVPRRNQFFCNNSNGLASPGSAPSVLLPMHNPFDIPYGTHEERPNLTDESFRKEFLAENRDLMLCRHASVSWRALFSLDAIGDQDKMATNDISFKPRAPQKLKTAVLALGSHLEKKDVKKVLEKESCQENEAISSGCSAEDHATQEGQAAQQGPDSVDIKHKEDKDDTQKKEVVAENIGVSSSSSSSSEENLPCKPDREEILRSLLSFRRNIVLPKNDDYQDSGFTHNSDQTILNNIKSDDGFLYAARVMNDHPRSNSLASDMLVEVSEISSPRSISSLEEEYPGNEEVKEVSSHPSQVDTSHESNSTEVPEISSQQDISGVSRNNHDAEALTSDVLPEKVFEENSINSSNSLSSSKTGLPDITQTHSLDSNIEDLADSSEKNNIGDITICNVSDSETPMNDNLEKSNTANKMDNETPKQILPPMDLPESSNGSNANSVNHQDLSESSLQNQQNENKTSVQSDSSLRSPENRRDDEVVPEFEFSVSSAENEASGVVSEIENGQVPIISSSGSSPKSVLQPKFSSDHVSLMDPTQGTTTEHQQSHNEIVDDDSVLPVVDLNHSAFQNVSPRQDDSTSQPSHVIDRLQSPRFSDALFCLPFRSTVEEPQNCDASISTSESIFYQDIHDPYPHQSNFNQEASTSNHIDNSAVNDNQARTNLESVENIEGDNHSESSMKQDAAAVFMEPSNSSSSKSTEDTKDGIKEIDGQEGAFGTLKSTEGVSESGPDVNLKELNEATLDDVANQSHESEAKDSSLPSKALDAVIDQKQTELSHSTGDLVTDVDVKSNFNQEASTSNHIDNSVVNDNQARTNLESVENIEGDNHSESSMKQDAAAVFMEPSNSSSLKSTEDTKDGIKEIDGQEGAFGTSKSTEGDSESGPHVNLKELHEATLDDVANQSHESEGKDISLPSKALDAVIDQKQTELSHSTGDLVTDVDVKSNLNQEASTSNHIDNSVVNDNQARTNLESVENIEGDNHSESAMKQDAAAIFMEPSNSSSSKSTEDTKDGIKEIDGQEGAFGTSKSTEGDSESGPDVNLKELHEATLDDVANQSHESEAKYSSLQSKALDAVIDQKQTELSHSTGDLVTHVDVKEPLDPPLESTMEEGNNSTAIKNDSVINKSEDSELKSVEGDIGEASDEHVIRSKDVHNPSELDATLDLNFTADVEGGLNNHSEVEITTDDNK